jgi:hypothetical protein
MEISDLRRNESLILECISGSRAYGLATPKSDTDIKGVFLLSKVDFYGLDYTAQVNNSTNDIVFYELKRFMELLSVNNPNILELLNTPEEHVIYRHPLFKEIQSKDILSKLCKNTFGKFAISQIKKAKGLKKKIVNPIAKERKRVLDFCYVNYKNGSVSLVTYLKEKKYDQTNCGLVKIPHMRDVYGLYHNIKAGYKGIVQSEDSNDISLSSIQIGETQKEIMFFNKDAYSRYCKEYKEYWDWVENRNEERYANTKSHGKNYDAKNMMHTFRLLDMAIEIAREKTVNVHRPNRAFLLDIKSGKFEYADLLEQANKKQLEMEEAFEKSSLPEKPNLKVINQLSYQLRDSLY